MAEGVSIAGMWAADALVAVECVRFATGASYAGGVEGGMYHGEGKYTWADGSWYQGGWHHNKCHGEGQFCDKEGKLHQGQYYQSTGPGLP
jgi:hypothetical protein